MDSLTLTILRVTIVLAFITHAICNRHEPSVVVFVRCTFAALVLLGSGLLFSDLCASTSQILVLLFYVTATFSATLLASIAVYRLYCHPLGQFDGPKLARLSKFYTVLLQKEGQVAYKHYELHGKYGDFVRVGPNWISISSIKAIHEIYGYGHNVRQFEKGPWYHVGVNANYHSLQHCRDDHMHAQRRKLWDRGLSQKALSDYEPDIRHFVDLLERGVGHSTMCPDKIFDMSKWSAYFSIDVTGVLGFGESFNCLETDKNHFFIETLAGFFRTMSPFSQIPGIKLALIAVLPTSPQVARCQNFTDRRFAKRMQLGSSRRDIFSWLLGEERETGFKMTEAQLTSDAMLVIIAGSDTVRSTITWLWFYLLREPHHYKRLQQELDVYIGKHNDVSTSLLAKLPFLNACINETLRLQPSVPGGLQRLVPPEGAFIDGKFIPGGTTVSVSAYVIQRDPRYWSPAPNSFRPDRWLNPANEIAANKLAFIPFSHGPRSCPGRNLAYMEIRLIFGTIASRYDAELLPKFDCNLFESSVRDYFTIQYGSLPIVFKPRQDYSQ